jgi:hypothetical protein
VKLGDGLLDHADRHGHCLLVGVGQGGKVKAAQKELADSPMMDVVVSMVVPGSATAPSNDCDPAGADPHDATRIMTALETKPFNVGTDLFRDPQPVQRQHGDQGVIAGPGETGGDKHRPDLVAIQPGGIRLIIQPRPANVHRWRVIQQAFFDGVVVQAGDRAQPPRDRCSCPAEVLEMTGERFDVVTTDREQGDPPVVAPPSELAKIQRVRLTGQPRVAAQESRQRSGLGVVEQLVRHATQHLSGHGHDVLPTRVTDRTKRRYDRQLSSTR